jgi:hypothetical protein
VGFPASYFNTPPPLHVMIQNLAGVRANALSPVRTRSFSPVRDAST